MAISLTAQTTASQGGGGATSLVFPAITPAAGDLLVAMFRQTNTSDVVTGIADGHNTWRQLDTSSPVVDAVNSFTDSFWYALNAVNVSTIVTISYSAKIKSQGNLSSWAGVATSAAFERATNNAVTSTTWQTGTLDTTNAADLIIGAVFAQAGAIPGTLSDYGTSGGTPTALSTPAQDTAFAYQVVSATGNYGFQYASSAGTTGEGIIAAFKAVVAGAYRPRGRPRPKRIPRTKAKRPTRSSAQLRIPGATTVSPNVQRTPILGRPRAQKKRLPQVRAKKPLLANLTKQLIPPAPRPVHSPILGRPKAQAKRIPRIKAKRPTRSSVQLRIPRAPFPERALPTRRPQGQKKRLPQIKAKRPLRANLTKQLIPPSPAPVRNLVLGRPKAQPRRIPHTKAKRPTRSSIQLRIPQAPQAPHADRAPVFGRPKAQPRRVPHVKAKRPTRSSIELRIPRAPFPEPPLPVRARKVRRKAVVPVRKAAQRKSRLFIGQTTPATFITRVKRHPIVRPKALIRTQRSPAIRILPILHAPVPIMVLPIIRVRRKGRIIVVLNKWQWRAFPGLQLGGGSGSVGGGPGPVSAHHDVRFIANVGSMMGHN
jgi:hypothetical protein